MALLGRCRLLRAIGVLACGACSIACHTKLSRVETCPWRIPKLAQNQTLRYDAKMRDLVVLFVHLVVTIARLTRPGGIRSVVAESILIKHQLQILNRNRKRAPNLRSLDRIIVGFCAGFCALFIRRLGSFGRRTESRIPRAVNARP